MGVRAQHFQFGALLSHGLQHFLDPRVVHVQHGWWVPEEPGPDHGVWRSNANVLTRNGPPYDPAMGTYHLRGLLCRIAPVRAGEA